jgi:hypothetical protein
MEGEMSLGASRKRIMVLAAILMRLQLRRPAVHTPACLPASLLCGACKQLKLMPPAALGDVRNWVGFAP